MGLPRNVYKEAQKVERILENKKFHFFVAFVEIYVSFENEKIPHISLWKFKWKHLRRFSLKCFWELNLGALDYDVFFSSGNFHGWILNGNIWMGVP
jgi:hypothetical protein